MFEKIGHFLSLQKKKATKCGAFYLAECEQDIRKSRLRRSPTGRSFASTTPRILEGIEKAKISQKYKGRKAVITDKL